MAGPPPTGKQARNRKLLMYGGVAAALLLLMLLARRGGGASAPSTDSGTPSPVVTPGATGGVDPTAYGQPDNTAQLASFESSLADQLPAVISSSIAAGLANGLPYPVQTASVAADTATDPGGSAPDAGASDLAGSLAALAGFNVATAQLFRGTGAGGQQKAAAGGHGKTKKSTSAKKTVHPKATSHHPTKTKTTPTTKRKHPNTPTGRAHRRHG